MIKDPYSVLGVPTTATKDEIKSAYRKKVKEVHPDLHPNDPTANDRMNEVNQAYDMLMNPDKYRRQSYADPNGGYGTGSTYSGRYSPYGNGNPFGNNGGWTYVNMEDFDFGDLFGFGTRARRYQAYPDPEDSAEVRKVVDEINSGLYSRAWNHLSQMSASQRTHRWFYLGALAHSGMGNRLQAEDYIAQAVEMEPKNPTYEQILQDFRQSANTYQGYRNGYPSQSINMSKICTGLCLSSLLFRQCGLLCCPLGC